MSKSIVIDGVATLSPVSFQQLPGWLDDDHVKAFESFLVSAKHMVETPYKTRRLGVSSDDLVRVAQASLSFDPDAVSPDQARSFFEDSFTPHLINSWDEEEGFVTAFYEPEVYASRSRSQRFCVPLYRQPEELVKIRYDERPSTMDPYFRYARKTTNGFEPFHDRPSIEAGALDGRNLELVWLENKVIAFFIHVQGAAKLILDDGSVARLTYAAKSGHPYTSIAKVLCAQTGIDPAQMTADRLADWMYANPDSVDSLLSSNKSYIFFKEVTGQDPDHGPIAAAKVPLVAGRSLAIDRTLHTFGTPIWLTVPEPLPGQARSLARLMTAHDTGSAIVGPARGDIFVGSGDRAGDIAGRVRHDATMHVLIPKNGSEE